MELNEYLKSQKGLTPTGVIIFIVIAAILILFGIVIIRPFLYSMSFNNEIKSITRNCMKKSDNVFLKRIKEGANARNFKLKESDIEINRGYENDYLGVKLKYSYDLTLPYYEKTLIFETSTKQSIYETEDSEDSEEGEEKRKKPKGFFDKLKETFGL
jgi:hypothetical protein